MKVYVITSRVKSSKFYSCHLPVLSIYSTLKLANEHLNFSRDGLAMMGCSYSDVKAKGEILRILTITDPKEQEEYELRIEKWQVRTE